jgi:hypothetical protein
MGGERLYILKNQLREMLVISHGLPGIHVEALQSSLFDLLGKKAKDCLIKVLGTKVTPLM